MDWAKDIFLLFVFTHTTSYSAVLIGAATIAPMTFSIIQIFILTSDQYCEIYGDIEYNGQAKEERGCCTNLGLKFKRIMKEIFML